MSGGVDSSVAAALAAEAGHETIGATLRLLPGGQATGFGCCGSPQDAADARRTAEKIGIPHYVLNFDEVFQRTVVDAFVADYLGQRTPNPCVECNRKVKFGALLALADAWKADFVATGHYARVERSGDGSARLMRPADREKDQTYFLHALGQRELARTMFPLGGLTKPEVRERARRLGLPTAEKPESQEICFVPGRDYRAFVRARSGARPEPGDIRDGRGRRLGRHTGLSDYTVGQRRGLGLSSPEPLYVTRLDGGTNTLVVGGAEETYARRFTASAVGWTRGVPRSERLLARVRHRARPAAARWADAGPDRVEVSFDEPQRALSPGQAAVFYDVDGEEVLGGGTIEEAS